MNTDTIIYRLATSNDIAFMSQILVDAAAASGVNMSVHDLPNNPDTYQYIEGFPKGSDVGIIAEITNKQMIGAAWIRLLPTDEHVVTYPLPELTMGVIPECRRMGIGERMMEELYKAAIAMNIPEISLGVHKENLPAVNLYWKQGWKVDGTYKEYIMMSRKL